MGEPTTADAGLDIGPIALHGLDGLREQAGQDLGASGWWTVEQDKIDPFAALTGDQQWIHVDPQRASSGPYGVTIQHGFLTLGLATGLLWPCCVADLVFRYYS